MVRLRRPPEWGVEPVPDSLRVLRTFDLFVLWSSLGAGRAARAAVRTDFVGGLPRLPRRLGPRERPLGRRGSPRKSGGRADDGQPAADPRSFRILRPYRPKHRAAPRVDGL